jgi:prepilin-type N-terminal cleavage/methylation domain-containing protein
MARATHEAGFTLAELVIVIAVISIAAMVFASTFAEAVRSYRFIDTEKDLLQQSRYAEERITRELGRARGRAAVLAATTRCFAFVDRDSAMVAISWDGTKGGDLVYTKNGVARPLAGAVDSLSFAYWKLDGSPAGPVVAPAATDVRRVTVFLRLRRDGQTVDAEGATFLRTL